MKRSALVKLLFAAVLISVGINAAVAQPLYRPGNEGLIGPQLNRRLDSAEAALQSLIAERAELAKQLAEAQAKLRKEDRDYRNARVEVRSEHNETPELVQARERFRQAQATFLEARHVLLSRLRETPAYKGAVAARDEAAATVRHWPDGPQFAKTRQEFARELTEALRHVRDLEEQAIEADSTARSAKQERDELSAKVAKLVAERDADIASDPRLSSAKVSRERAQQEVDRLRQAVAVVGTKAEQAERAYETWVRQRLAFERAERANRWHGWGPWYPW